MTTPMISTFTIALVRVSPPSPEPPSPPSSPSLAQVPAPTAITTNIITVSAQLLVARRYFSLSLSLPPSTAEPPVFPCGDDGDASGKELLLVPRVSSLVLCKEVLKS
eukprot:6179055-Pleurochrysis_carterae.AAC.1